MPAKLIITGVEEIDLKLGKIGNPTATNKICRRAMRNAMKGIKSLAEAYTPRDTGAMAGAYKIIAAKRSRKGPKYVVGINTVRVPAKETKKGARSWYPAAVEYGVKGIGRLAVAPMKSAFEDGGDGARLKALHEIEKGIMDLVTK